VGGRPGAAWVGLIDLVISRARATVHVVRACACVDHAIPIYKLTAVKNNPKFKGGKTGPSPSFPL
jgi:hypothetical protein